MRWCSLQTNEHDLQAIMYPIICKYHRLNINNGNKVPVFPRYICNRWQNMIVQPSQTHNHGKIWQQWERWIICLGYFLDFMTYFVNYWMSGSFIIVVYSIILEFSFYHWYNTNVHCSLILCTHLMIYDGIWIDIKRSLISYEYSSNHSMATHLA